MSNLQESMIAGIQSKLPGISADKLSELASTDLTAQFNSQLTNQLGNIQSSAESLMGASLNSIASSMPDVTAQFGAVNTLAGKLGSAASDVKGSLESDYKLTTLASDSAEAISQPVAFVSKPITDSIKGIDTMVQGATAKDYLSGMSLSEIDNVSKALGTTITTSSDMSNAIVNATNDLKAQVTGTKDSINSLSESILAPVSSTIKNFSDSLMGGIKNTVSAIDSVTGASSIIEATKELGKEALSILPAPMQNMISSMSDDYISSTIDKISSEKFASANYILGILSGSSSDASIVEKITHLGDSSIYSMLTDSEGKPLDSILGQNDSSLVSSLYKAAQILCPGITEPDHTDFRFNKDLYDILLQLATELGLTDLVKQLQECMGEEESSGNTYFDSRSHRVLRDTTSTVAESGNVSMYDTILDIIGPSSYTDPVGELRVLSANMEGTATNVETYEKVLETMNITKSDLMTESYSGETILSGREITFMTATNNEVVDSFLGSDTRKLVQSSVFLYG